MPTSNSLERKVVTIAIVSTLVAVLGVLAIVACVDVVMSGRELGEAADAASHRVEASLRAGDSQHALDGIDAIGGAKLYARDGKLLVETQGPRLRDTLATRIARRITAGEIACGASAGGETFCVETAAAPLAVRIGWWFRVLGGAALAAALFGLIAGWVVRRAIARRLQPVLEVVNRAVEQRDYSQRVPPDAGELGASINRLVEQTQEQELSFRRRIVEMEAVNKELEGFAYAASHDLRAPLGTVDGFAQALKDDFNDRLDDAGREYISWILEGCRQMRELIEGLLEMGRLARADMSHDEVDLSSLARSVAEQLRQKAPERQVCFEIREGAKAIGDARLLRAVLENLMSNAFKFTRDREDARIEFGVMPNGTEPAFYVRDNGAGFDPTQASKMFRPFQRLHSNREFEGTGIGLATVQKIVMRHGGKAWAEGEPGKGATIFFTAGVQTSMRDALS